MRSIWKIGITLGMVVALTACSSSQTKDESLDNLDDVVTPSSDAGTDAVPQVAVESPNNSTPPSAGPANVDDLDSLDSSTTPPPAVAEPSSMDFPPATPSASSEMPEPPGHDDLAEAPAPSAMGSGETEDYKVRRGDTLMKIAFELYGDVYKWKEIYELNRDKISSPNSIPKGIKIKVERPMSSPGHDEGSEKYLIKSGDTLAKISMALYGTTAKWKKLWKQNKHLIHNPNRIFAGFYLHYSEPATNLGTTQAELSQSSATSNNSMQQSGQSSMSNGSSAMGSMTPPAHQGGYSAPANSGGGSAAQNIPDAPVPNFGGGASGGANTSYGSDAGN